MKLLIAMDIECTVGYQGKKYGPARYLEIEVGEDTHPKLTVPAGVNAWAAMEIGYPVTAYRPPTARPKKLTPNFRQCLPKSQRRW